jgi:hypothetical protein
MPRGVPKAGFRRTKKQRAGVNHAPQFVLPISTETIPQIEAKLKDRFEALEVMSEATGRGINRSLIVSGPAGLGKSYTVESKLAALERKGHHVVYIKGYVRPLSLYKLLYEARFTNSVLVFDDSDSIFHDDVSMNLLKTACDSTERRVLHWLSRSLEREEDEDGESIPEKFEFEGSIIFITNYDFDALIRSGNKLAPHFEALVSRSHYLDLAMKTKMDYLVRIKQVVRGGMLRDRGMADIDTIQIMQFIENNVDRLRELSLRMVVKLAGLYKMDRVNWQKLAKQTCFRSA